MMACFFTSGALLIVLLTGSSYGYPAKKGYDPSSSGSHGANAPSAGSNWGGYAPSASGSGALSNPAHAQPAPDTEYTYSQPSGQRQPAATSYSSNSAARVPSGYASSSNVGAFQPATRQDIAWAVAPPSLSGENPGRGSAQLVSSNGEPLAPSNVSPPGYPQYQGGELSKYESAYEHGNSESETEEQGFQQSSPVAEVQAQPEPTSDIQPSGSDGRWPVLPYPYDYMFLTGQYPPGTFTHSSQSFEQGADHWQDSHHIRYHFPAYPVAQQVEMAPELKAPQSYKQPSQPVARRTGSANSPYHGLGYQGSSAQPGRFEQPNQGSSTGGHGMRKGGY